MKNKHRDKIVVVGAGNVGEAIAYTLMVRVQANDIVLIDVNADRARGAATDIAHGTSFHKQVWVRQGGYEECADAQIIIITAGIARKPGQTRLDLAKTNVSIVKSITENIMKYAKNPLILVVSNPADLTTAAVLEASGLPANRVIGSGTSLDTARFRYNLSTKLHVNVEDIQAYIVGEHGDSQVAVWSSAMVGGFPLEDYARQVGVSLDKKEIALVLSCFKHLPYFLPKPASTGSLPLIPFQIPEVLWLLWSFLPDLAASLPVSEIPVAMHEEAGTGFDTVCEISDSTSLPRISSHQ